MPFASTWQPVYGECGQIRDHYNQLVVDLSVPLKIPLTVRSGAAIRVVLNR